MRVRMRMRLRLKSVNTLTDELVIRVMLVVVL
jgi:hypothetical protein